MSELFDVIVIGGGPGGYRAAERSAQGGKKTAIFEQRAFGGTCLNEGCVPSKTLLKSAKIYTDARDAGLYGVSAENVKMDHKAVIERKNKVRKTLVSGVGASMKANKVTVVKQHGVITGKTANGFAVKAEDGTEYECRNLIIATGATAIVPGIPGVKEGYEKGFVITNKEVLDLEEVPGRMAIIGAGVIGLEMASYYTDAGCKCTIIELMDKVAGAMDKELSTSLQKDLEKKGVVFHLSSKVTKVTDNAVEFECGGKTESVPADKVLMAIGRKAAVDKVGLENIGLYIENGAVVTDEHLCTNVPGVYAIGDINGKVMQAHTAYREAEVAVHHMLGVRDCIRYDTIPSVVHTGSEAAAVGETEESAKAKGMDVKVLKLSMRYSGRFVAENEGGDGICKIVVNKKDRTVVGVHMFGTFAAEMIGSAIIMVESHWPVDDFKEIVFPHPTVSEVMHDTLSLM